MRKGIYLAEITEEGLLLVRKKDIWILPGGESKEGEPDDKCLFRKLKEELSVSEQQIKIYNFYNSFTSRTTFSRSLLEAKVYFGTLNGSLKPSAEISEAKHIKDFENYKISEITSKIVSSLIDNKYF